MTISRRFKTRKQDTDMSTASDTRGHGVRADTPAQFCVKLLSVTAISFLVTRCKKIIMMPPPKAPVPGAEAGKTRTRNVVGEFAKNALIPTSVRKSAVAVEPASIDGQDGSCYSRRVLHPQPTSRSCRQSNASSALALACIQRSPSLMTPLF